MMRVNILGAGLAGLSAAITLAENQIGSRLISPQSSERAQSVLAEGGINAALNIMGEDDTPEQHFADTMRGGVWLADPNAVAGLTAGAPGLVRWLRDIGVPFHMENGRMIQRNFGGQKKKRTAYAKSSTGKALMTALVDEARKYEAAGLIERYPHHTMLELLLGGSGDRGETEEKCCTGVRVMDIWSEEIFSFDGPVIAAFGGFNGMFPGRTTGTTQNTGDALATVFSQGAKIANPEFLQYHPTTVQIDGKCMLVSEAARGEGGRLYIDRDGQRWYFMEEKYPELKNLMPRDVISREMTQVLSEAGCGDQVYLDLTGLSDLIWRRRLPDLRSQLIHYIGIDPAKKPVPVNPGIHYFMGGLYVDEQHRTSIGGLFAAGECACQYHGANRLGGNSLLGAIYGGRRAAESTAALLSGERPGKQGVSCAAKDCKTAENGAGAEGRLSAERRRQNSLRPGFSERLTPVLLAGLSILRSETAILGALEQTDRILREDLTELERRRALLGKAMLMAALERKESRGAHVRTDFPERNDAEFQKTTVVCCQGEEIRVMFDRIPERREP